MMRWVVLALAVGAQAQMDVPLKPAAGAKAPAAGAKAPAAGAKAPAGGDKKK